MTFIHLYLPLKGAWVLKIKFRVNPTLQDIQSHPQSLQLQNSADLKKTPVYFSFYDLLDLATLVLEAYTYRNL